jgi:hypothetical protein
LKLLIDENLSPRLARWAWVDLHPGVIALREAELSAVLQWDRLKTALAFVEQACNGDLINRVLEVQEGGQCLMHAIPPEHVN